MSTVASVWAGKQKTERPADKLILWAMADAASKDSFECFSSVASLVEFTGLDRKTVLAGQQRLKAVGLIADTGRRKGDTKQIIVWALPVETVPETGSLETVPETELFQKRNCSTFPTEQSQKRDTEPVLEPEPQKASPSSETRKRKAPARSAVETLPDLPEGVTDEQWDGFVAMRKQIKKPLGPHAAKLAIRELHRLAEDGHPPGKVLEQSTLNGWQGLYPIKDDRRGQRNHSGERKFRDPLNQRDWETGGFHPVMD
ncbi:hypothetical protein CLG96_02035 [Sphingomonas oleivorans]|uniref:Helix-turn-helix domain-containing protein n=1 Tax=Sphingomonas oleivorans TaxID=1735121 RepID=A0A2T5G1C0_9SPHN|nr:hypothetical protein [Sphingomonas oleivorans]PTQ12944.1 hypothetical protein CLG96_02035 [Sphingomonas oleivorans]